MDHWKKGDIIQDTESSTESEATHEDTETNDDDEDDKPLSTILKAIKKPGLSATATGFSRQAEKDQSHTSQLRRMQMKKMEKKRKGPREKKPIPSQAEGTSNVTTDTLMARKIADHQARREAEAKKKSYELTPEKKYDYLLKKDWDEDVILDDGKWLATDL